MKLLVFSDSHGRRDLMEKALAKEEGKEIKPDGILFAGDGLSDALAYREGRSVFYAVAGNCDSAREGAGLEAVFTLQGLTIYLCHGHRWHVKMGTQRLLYRAQEVGAQVAIYGHTHRQKAAYQNGVLLLNPGALEAGKYAVLKLPKEGLPEVKLKDL